VLENVVDGNGGYDYHGITLLLPRRRKGVAKSELGEAAAYILNVRTPSELARVLFTLYRGMSFINNTPGHARPTCRAVDC
jgi:hypothetical protein